MHTTHHPTPPIVLPWGAPQRELLVVSSPRAEGRPELTEAVEHAARRGHRVTRLTLSHPEAGAQLAARLRRGDLDAVIAAGGDGTLNVVANALATADAPPVALGILPLGTANDFATGLGLTALNPCRLIDLILEGDPTPIDLGRVNGRLFVNFASGALGAEITTETPQRLKRVMGGAAYLATGFAVSLSKRPRPVRLRAPGFSWEGRALYIGVGNARLAGGGFEVSRGAMLDDGLLDLTVLPELGSWAEVRAMVGQLVREHALPRGFSIARQVPWLEIEAPEGLQVNTDGEPMFAERYRFELFERQVPLYMPAAARASLTQQRVEVAA